MNIKNLLLEQHIPQKTYFKSSELPSLLKVKPHEINYWETEFPKLKNNRSKQGQKFYEREDVLMLLAIKHLIHDKKLTIAGTKKILSESYEMFAPTKVAAAENLEHQEQELPNCTIAQYQADSTLYEASLIIEENNEQNTKQNQFKEQARRLKREQIIKFTNLHILLNEVLSSIENFENKITISVLKKYMF